MPTDRDWLKRVIEFLVGMGIKRHLKIGRLLIGSGVAFFAVPALWVQLASLASDSLEKFYKDNPPSQGFTATDYAGFLCILLGTFIFWFFERREAVIVIDTPGFTLGVPDGGVTLKAALDVILERYNKPISLIGFSADRLSANLLPGEYHFTTLYDAICGAVNLTNVPGESEPKIELDEQTAKIEVTAKYG